MASPPFRFKRFLVEQTGAVHPVGTDSVLLGAWASVDYQPKKILDLGTGTGVLALMLAQRTENQMVEKIVGIDCYPPSVACAAENFLKSPWQQRLTALKSTVQEFGAHTPERFDLIVCNPPYFSEKIISPDPLRQLGRHQSALPMSDLCAVVSKLLTPTGRFCVILPKNEGQNLMELFASKGLYFSRNCAVRSKKDKKIERMMLEFWRKPYFSEKKELIIFDENARYTEDFLQMTASFYLDRARQTAFFEDGV